MRIPFLLAACCWASQAFAQSSLPLFNQVYHLGRAASVVQRADEKFLMLGDSIVTGVHPLLVTCIDRQGSLRWTKKVPISSLRRTVDAAVSPAGFVGVALKLTNDSSGLALLDSAGNLVWQKSWQGLPPEALTSTPDGGWIMATATPSYFADYNSTVYRIDPQGNLLWSVPVAEYALTSVILTADGGFALTGSVRSDTSLLSVDIAVVKLTGNGQVSWQQSFGAVGLSEFGTALAEAANGNLLIGNGTYNGAVGNDGQGQLLMLSATGDSLFHMNLPVIESPDQLISLPDQGWIVGCQAKSSWHISPTEPEPTLVALRLDSTLQQNWITRTPGVHPGGNHMLALPDGQFAWAMNWDSTVLSWLEMRNPHFKLVTFAADGTIGVATDPQASLQVSVFPNPATDQATLVLPASLAGQLVSVRISDLSGRVCVEQHLSATPTLPLPIATLAPGLYEIRLAGKDAVLARTRLVITE